MISPQTALSPKKPLFLTNIPFWGSAFRGKERHSGCKSSSMFIMLKKNLFGTRNLLRTLPLLVGIVLMFTLSGCDLFGIPDETGNKPVIPSGGGTTAGTQANPIVFTGDGSGTYALTSAVQAGWFTFTAPGRHELTVRDYQYRPANATTSPYTLDVRVTVLDASLQFVSSSGGTAMNGIDIGANNQSPVAFNSLTPGSVYYVKIDRYSEYSSFGFFYIGIN